MKHLIVAAHPSASSFTMALTQLYATELIWPDTCQAPIGLSHGFRAPSLNLYESTAQESRDARAEVGDDDQAHIRGLATGISFVRRGAASL